MLKKSSANRRHTCGYPLLALAFLAVGGIAWAAEPSVTQPASVALQIRWVVNGTEILNVGAPVQLVVSPNHQFDLSAAAVGDTAAGGIYHSSCILKAPKSDRVSILCFLTRNGEVFATPSLTIEDSQPAVMEIADSGHDFDFRMEITSSFKK